MSLLIMVVGLGSAATTLAAQATGSVSGRVVDQDGRAVAGAMVRPTLGGDSVRTDANGVFRLTSLPIGAVRLQVTAAGFIGVATSATVRAGGTDELTIRLAAATVLHEVTVAAEALPGSVRYGGEMRGSLIVAGAKSEIVQIAGLPANLAEKTGRQVFARVPGAFVYDMDGSGNQINVSTRGLDAHRSWELNVRQDGVLLNSDMYGYPASHYSPPMEAVERVELTRGTAALQYGSQFGGLLNYVTRRPPADRALGGQAIMTGGGFGLRSAYVAAGGTSGRWSYYGYLSERVSDGYRTYAKSDAAAQYLSATVQLTPNATLRGQVGHSTYLYRLPGPLTDAQFAADPRQSTRSRNYYSPDITIPSLSFQWRAPSGTQISASVSGLFGPRNSVLFSGFATTPDEPSPATGAYADRQVDIDKFKSLTSEVRVTTPWRTGGREHLLAAGVAATANDMWRRQGGTATAQTGYDLTITGAGFPRDVHYRTTSAAFYLENLFRLTSSWSVVPGARLELGRTKMEGRLAYYDPADTPRQVEHGYPLFGLRTAYQVPGGREFYAGWSQSYRPQILKDLLPGNALERTDPDIDDSRGWTLEAGMRGLLAGRIVYDVNLFELRIHDRFGTVLETDQGTTYVLRTNVGSSRTRGVELALDATVAHAGETTVRLHTATSYYDGTYLKGTVASGGVNTDITGNRVESVPKLISRTGVAIDGSRLSVGVLFSHVASSFADPLNTVEPSANGAVGVVPAYSLVDVNAAFRATSWLRLRAGVNNAFDRQYFTKRPQFYPGPGIWPSDGRSAQVVAELGW